MQSDRNMSNLRSVKNAGNVYVFGKRQGPMLCPYIIYPIPSMVAWCIYLHGWFIYMGFHKGKYTNRPMDLMGYCQKRSKKPLGEKSDGSIRGQLFKRSPKSHLQVPQVNWDASPGLLSWDPQVATCRPHLPGSPIYLEPVVAPRQAANKIR